MSKTTMSTCDCGCGAQVINPVRSGWLVLSQLPPDEHGDSLKLQRELQFSSFNCLQKWAEKAVSEGASLQETARSLSPRGVLTSQKVLGLYV